MARISYDTYVDMRTAGWPNGFLRTMCVHVHLSVGERVLAHSFREFRPKNEPHWQPVKRTRRRAPRRRRSK